MKDVKQYQNELVGRVTAEGSSEVTRMINPKPIEIEELCKKKLVGFNNRKYDNHILYAWMQGYSNEQAYNLSYADIYDFSSKKQSLKKWEIELGIHHMENSYPNEALRYATLYKATSDLLNGGNHNE